MSKITKYLNQLLVGNVFDTPEICEAYSTDQSILKIMPKMVAFPESTSDLQKVMSFFNQLADKKIRVPIAVRGSGLDEMGADLSTGLVISTEKLNRLEEIDTRERLVRVQAGITLKELNTALKVCGLTIPVKANGNETIGSLIANCPTDNYAGKYGGIMAHVERAEIVLANGECIHTNRYNARMIAKKSDEKTLEGNIYKALAKIADDNLNLLNTIYQENKGSSGYSTIPYIFKNGSIDLLPLFFSSEGSLGIISEVILHATVIQSKPSRMIATFTDLKPALDFLNRSAAMKPLELNLMDIRILDAAKEYGNDLAKIIKNTKSGFVTFISFNDKPLKAKRLLKKCQDYLPKTARVLIDTPENNQVFAEFENALASFLNLEPNGKRYPVLSNFFIPSKNLVAFHKNICTLEEKLKIPLELFGSFSASNYSLRPKFDLNDPNLEKHFLALLKAGNFIIEHCDGSLTGGYPEGRVKAIITNQNLSKEERKLYQEVKTTFDPNNILNPSIKLNSNTEFVLSHLNTSKTPEVML